MAIRELDIPEQMSETAKLMLACTGISLLADKLSKMQATELSKIAGGASREGLDKVNADIAYAFTQANSIYCFLKNVCDPVVSDSEASIHNAITDALNNVVHDL
jgi:hypothetical protein